MTTLSSMTTIDTKEAKEGFSELVNRVAHSKERIILTRRGKEVAVIVPIEDLILLQASQNKTDLHDAIEAFKEARSHGTLPFEDLKKELNSK